MSRSESFSPLFDEFSSVDVDEWRAKVRTELGEAFSENLLSWSTLEGVSIPTYLHRDDLDDVAHVDPDRSVPPLSDSDASPANDWRIRQTITHPNPDTANERARTAIEGGATDLGLEVFPDGGRSTPLVRRPRELATILEGVNLSKTGLHFESGLAGGVLFCAFREEIASRDGIPNDFRGSTSYDPVAALATGSLEAPERAFDLAQELMEATRSSPGFRPVSVDARVYHDAGASTVQELSYTIGALSELLAQGTDRGTDLSSLLEAIQLIVPVSTSYFVEIAKLRALRLLVPQVIEAYADDTDPTDSLPDPLPIQAETSRRTETLYDPYVNLLRATTEGMAAVLGGCDVLSIRPYDASAHVPDSFSMRLARNTQLILQHEAHLDQVADPAAGSYYLETLTDTLAKKAWGQFQDLEAEGGLLAALQQGTVQSNIETTRHRRREAVNQREQVLVGTTHYPALDERQRDALASPTDGRRPPSSDAELDDVSLPAIRQALRDDTSLPTIADSLRPNSPTLEPLPRIRLAAPIESLRLRTERYAEAHDGPPTVLLVPIGPVSARSARATFARNFLGVAGFEIIEPLKFETPAEAATEALESQADIVVLCSADEEYESLAPALRMELTDRNLEALLAIAGNPDHLEDSLPADAYIHQNAPLQETLEHLQEQLGVTSESDSSPAHA